MFHLNIFITDMSKPSKKSMLKLMGSQHLRNFLVEAKCQTLEVFILVGQHSGGKPLTGGTMSLKKARSHMSTLVETRRVICSLF